MNKIFKFAVVLSYVSYTTWFFIPYLGLYDADPQAVDLLTWSNYKSVIKPNDFIAYFLFTAYTVTTVGLLLFWSWAKQAFLVLTVLSLGFIFLFGFSVATPLDVFLSSITHILDGVLLTMLYLTSVGNNFNESV